MTALLNSTLRLTAAGPVPADVAWERYERLALWPTWAPQIKRAEADVARLTPGTQGRVIAPPGVVAVYFTILDVAADQRRWSWTARRGPLELRLEHGVDAEGSGSRTWLVLHGPGPVLLGYAPLAWYALHRLVTLPAADG